LLVQALIATLAGIAVAVRAYWSRIRSFLGRSPVEADDEDDSIDRSLSD
jgi:hypothetical protein